MKPVAVLKKNQQLETKMYSDPILKLFLGLLVPLVISCGNGGGSKTEWTVLIYMAGDNNLSESAIVDIEEMEVVGSSGKIKVIVQVDYVSEGAERLLVKKGSSKILQSLGEVNMADGGTLTDFISWATGRYPADRTALILWSHGNGHQKADLGPIHEWPLRSPYGILQDDTDGIGCCLSNLDVREAIEQSGFQFDLLGFDASMMGEIETAYEFRNVADVLVFSQETGQDNGWNYAPIVEALRKQPDIGPEELSGLIVQSYRNFYEDVFYPANPGFTQLLTISAIDLEELKNSFVPKLDELALAMMNSLDSPGTLNAITSARSETQNIAGDFCNIYGDLFDWIDNMRTQAGLDPAVTDPLEELALLEEGVILSEYHGQARPDAGGLSIVFYEDPDPFCSTFDQAYLDGTSGHAFIQETRWDEFLSGYYEETGLL